MTFPSGQRQKSLFSRKQFRINLNTDRSECQIDVSQVKIDLICKKPNVLMQFIIETCIIVSSKSCKSVDI